MTTVKTQIVFPQNLLEEMDRIVKNRERSEFVVQAVEEKLRRLRLEKSLDRAAGLWKDRVDLKTDQDVRKYVRRLRGADTRRNRKIVKAWRNG